MAKSKNQTQNSDQDRSLKKVRTSMYIDPEILEKLQYIAFMDSGYDSQTELMDEAFRDKIAVWEKKNGPAVKK